MTTRKADAMTTYTRDDYDPPFVPARPPMPTHTPCNCTIEYGATDDVRDHIAYCSLHEEAEEMRALIDEYSDKCDCYGESFDCKRCARARALLTRVEG